MSRARSRMSRFADGLWVRTKASCLASKMTCPIWSRPTSKWKMGAVSKLEAVWIKCIVLCSRRMEGARSIKRLSTGFRRISQVCLILSGLLINGKLPLYLIVLGWRKVVFGFFVGFIGAFFNLGIFICSICYLTSDYYKIITEVSQPENITNKSENFEVRKKSFISNNLDTERSINNYAKELTNHAK